jgi:hypothetical protein
MAEILGCFLLILIIGLIILAVGFIVTAIAKILLVAFLFTVIILLLAMPFYWCYQVFTKMKLMKFNYLLSIAIPVFSVINGAFLGFLLYFTCFSEIDLSLFVYWQSFIYIAAMSFSSFALCSLYIPAKSWYLIHRSKKINRKLILGD